MKLEAVEIKATSARMEWRHLDEQEEKPHVDGVQVEILDLEPNLIKRNSFLQLRRIQLDTRGIPVSHVPEVTLLSGSAQTYCSSCHLTIWSQNNCLYCRPPPSFIGTPTTMCWRTFRWWPCCQTIELQLYLLHPTTMA